jgi:hypothetical protein
MQAYKSQLRRALVDHGWEIVEVLDSDDWWADEYWKVQSRRNLWGLEVFLTFWVDPLWEGPRKRGTGVWAVGMTRDSPENRLGAEQGIAELCLRRGRFDEKLATFVASLDSYRDKQGKAQAREPQEPPPQKPETFDRR